MVELRLATDRRTDGQTQGNSIYHADIASRGKNILLVAMTDERMWRYTGRLNCRYFINTKVAFSWRVRTRSNVSERGDGLKNLALLDVRTSSIYGVRTSTTCVGLRTSSMACVGRRRRPMPSTACVGRRLCSRTSSSAEFLRPSPRSDAFERVRMRQIPMTVETWMKGAMSEMCAYD